MKKKSQFKVQQTAFMLLAITLFFILVFIFWLVLQSKNLRKTATQLEEDRAVILSQFIPKSSEFSCSREIDINYCIDTDKILILENKAFYKELWPVSYIKIRKITNETKEVVCSKANYPNCNVFNVFKNEEADDGGTGIGSFVALCRKERENNYLINKCELGKIIIGYEVKTT